MVKIEKEQESALNYNAQSMTAPEGIVHAFGLHEPESAEDV